jgi:hypothetical protein
MNPVTTRQRTVSAVRARGVNRSVGVAYASGESQVGSNPARRYVDDNPSRERKAENVPEKHETI